MIWLLVCENPGRGGATGQMDAAEATKKKSGVPSIETTRVFLFLAALTSELAGEREGSPVFKESRSRWLFAE